MNAATIAPSTRHESTGAAAGWVGRLDQILRDLDEIWLEELMGEVLPDGYVRPWIQEQAKFRLLTAELAMRAYRAERGDEPRDWEDVVSQGLPRLGVDPWDEDGRPLRWRRLGDKIVVYSIGPNQVDDGGQGPTVEDGFADDSTGDQRAKDVFP